MKQILFTLISLFLLSTGVYAQDDGRAQNHPRGTHARPAKRKFQIIVENERQPDSIINANRRLAELQAARHSAGQRGLLGDLLREGYAGAFKQKTLNASSNIVSLGISYVSEALKSKREKWYRKAQQQCYYRQSLSTDTQINDFYALPSTKGAMDPENLKFEGFGCKNYIETTDESGEGVGVFYIFCSMRRDSVGLRHIVNHSKFLVEVDSLIFYPKYCNLPNDSSNRADSRFDFEKRDSLQFQLSVRFYSSWMNQAMMIMDNQQLGEFRINVLIDKRKLTPEGMFVYNRKDSDFDNLISVDGDCFIVPRSYTGTLDGVSYQPTWGTGQYRIEMDIVERCSIVDSYYQIRPAGNGEDVAYAEANPGKTIWDKSKWKTEWKAMNERRRNDTPLKNLWKCIVSAYKGSGWVATFTDPAATALYSWEAQRLDEWLDITDKKQQR